MLISLQTWCCKNYFLFNTSQTKYLNYYSNSSKNKYNIEIFLLNKTGF